MLHVVLVISLHDHIHYVIRLNDRCMARLCTQQTHRWHNPPGYKNQDVHDPLKTAANDSGCVVNFMSTLSYGAGCKALGFPDLPYLKMLSNVGHYVNRLRDTVESTHVKMRVELESPEKTSKTSRYNIEHSDPQKFPFSV